jgi:hypothetical protein
MKTVSVHKLRYHFPKVEGLLRSCGELGVTKDGCIIARLKPEPGPVAAVRPPLPDFLGRMKEGFEDKVLDVTGAEIISADRDAL